MSRRRIDQLLPAAHWGDATGDASRHLAGALRTAGYDAEVYALSVDEPLAGQVHPFESRPPTTSTDLTVLHFALPSPLTDALANAHGRKALVYHNLTPPEMLARHAPEVGRLTAAGQRELAALGASAAVDLAIGVSEYNTGDLDAAGFGNTRTLPLPVDLGRYDQPADPVLDAALHDGPRLFLTVGRIAPNKRLEDFLRVASYYLRYVDPDACFVAVGGFGGLEGYYDALMDLHQELGLDQRVRLVGRVPHADLIAWYRNADVYLCTSEHEGFCAPLLEAMHFGVPILARAAAAVPETLGGAGILFEEPDPARLGELLHLLAQDDSIRERLRAVASQRLRELEPGRVVARWVETLSELAESAA